MRFILLCLLAIVNQVNGHGHIVIPSSTRHGGSIEKGGDCTNGACYWFTNNIEISGEPTLPGYARSVQLNVTGGDRDVYKTSPWRAPGSAAVLGSGCGVAGGSPTYYANGGNPPPGIEQGMDGIKLPKMTPVEWKRGSVQEVAWSIAANHGGGYVWRLCKNEGEVNEQCFQNNILKFASNYSYLVYSDGRKSEKFKMTTVSEGTYPKGSTWARGPVPACYICDAYQKCGTPLPPVPGKVKSDWDAQVNCYAMCDGAGASKAAGYCPEGSPQFPEPIRGISGFGKIVWDWGIADLVQVPEDLETGDYLLSWRWDCEESTQVWQNCADISIV